MKAPKRRNAPGRVWSLVDAAPLVGTTLHEHVSSLLPVGGRGPLPRAGEPLPDEPPQEPSRLRWGGGSFDGIMALRGGRSDGNEPLVVAAAVSAFVRQTPDTRGLHSLSELVCQLQSPQAIDRFLHAVVEGKGASKPRLRELGRWLCVQGVRREQAKMGMALFGISGHSGGDGELVTHLGLLEELTLYAVVALTNLLPDADKAILNLADQVENWGRIHCVLRLRNSTKPDVAEWLLYGGYRNGVMTEEIAYVAATTGGLRAALDVDGRDELLDHAGALLAALAVGGPAEDMKNFADGGASMAAYFARMLTAPASLSRLRHLSTLEDYLARWSDGNPWIDAQERDSLSATLGAVLERDDWRQVAEAALVGYDLAEVKSAITLVRRFAIDPVPVVERWLPKHPLDPYLWQTLLYAADKDEMLRLIDTASRVLPFDDLPRGPARDLGLGPGYEATRCLDLILQRLRDFPGVGTDAIAEGLASRVTRCRNMAVRALETWPLEARPLTLVDSLRQMAWSDPDPSLKKRARRVSEGLPGDE